MAREDLGTKRVCPETGKKFYDLGKDPVVSPYTGKEYPLSFFEEVPAAKPPAKPADEKKAEPVAEAAEEETADDDDAPEFVSLEDADGETADDDDDEEDIPDIPDVEIEVEDDNEEDDSASFLEEEESDDDLSDVIGDVSEDDET